MTVNVYNFTRQGTKVKKVSRRFTKQNGVVKQIVAGWTKRNGVVEQVYTTTPPPSFAYKIPKEYYGGPYAIYSDILIGGNTYNNKFYYLIDYLVGGGGIQINAGAGATYRGEVTFNYNNGVESGQSIITTSGSYTNHEVLISDPTNPIGYTKSGTNGATRIEGRAPFRISEGTYASYCQEGDEIVIKKFTETATTTGITVQRANKFSCGLMLYEGRSICIARQVTTTNKANDTKTFVVYDYDEVSEQKITYTPVVTYIDEAAWDDTGNPSTGVFTPNGQDCFFSVNWNYPGTEIKSSYLCKYNRTTKTLNKVEVPQGTELVGVYNNFLYVITSTRYRQNEWLLDKIQKYNLNLELVETRDLPDGMYGKIVQAATPTTTIHSNSRFIGLDEISGQDYTNLLDLDLY